MTELQQAIASGQVSADQIEAHRVAGDLPIVMFEPTIAQPVEPASRHIHEHAAGLLINYFLCAELGVKNAPEVTLEKQGGSESESHSWAFWILDADTTSYLHEDGQIEWSGTAWEAESDEPAAALTAAQPADWGSLTGHPAIESQIAEQTTAISQPVQPATPYAYAVYFPDQPCIELVHDLEDLSDDMTNRAHTITNLYDHAPSAQPVQPADLPMPAMTDFQCWDLHKPSAQMVPNEDGDGDFYLKSEVDAAWAGLLAAAGSKT